MNQESEQECLDEGFIPERMKITSSQEQQEKEEEEIQNRPEDYKARYISGTTPLKKEPTEVYWNVDSIPSKPSLNTRPVIQKANNEEVQSPFQKYCQSGDYELVYQRFQGQIFSDQPKNLFKNEIPLSSIAKYEARNYKIIKQFEQQPLSKSKNNNLSFDSKFEGGNLLCAFKNKRQPNSYSLFMQNDSNTFGYNQWFYFSVRNAIKGAIYKFEITNFKKRYSFFEEGMQPVVFSKLDAQRTGNGWTRKGNNINYSKSSIQDPVSEQAFYCLSFQLEVLDSDDYLTISSNMPYSYSKLTSSFKSIEQKCIENGLDWQMKIVSYTLQSNAVPYITIKKNNIQRSDCNQKHILMTARQHSGETWSSFLMEELLNEISQQSSSESQWIMDNFVIKVFPMLNIDGVINGNFRCDVSGSDLNRCWKNPDKLLNPHIFDIKRQIEKIENNGGIQLCFDLHCHSKDYNIFCYCCKGQNIIQSKKLSYLFSKLNSNFSFSSCTYGLSKSKQTTARAAIFNINNNMNTVTVEVSAFGAKNGDTVVPFEPYHMRQMAKTILEGSREYVSKKLLSRNDPIYQQIKKLKPANDSKKRLKTKGSAFSGSDSNPDIDEISLTQKINTILPKSLQSYFKPEQNQNVPKKKKKKLNKLKSKKKDHLPSFFSVEEPKKEEIILERSKTIAKKRIEDQQKLHKTLRRDNSQKKSKAEYSQMHPQELLHKFVRNRAPRTIQAERTQKHVPLVDLASKKIPFQIGNNKVVVEPKKKNNFLINQFSYTKNDIGQTFQTNQTKQPKLRSNIPKKIGLIRQAQVKVQDLPFLCIFSENKKKNQLEIMHQRLQKESTAVKKKQQKNNFILQKLRNRHEQKVDIIQRIWRQNFNRYKNNN